MNENGPQRKRDREAVSSSLFYHRGFSTNGVFCTMGEKQKTRAGLCAPLSEGGAVCCSQNRIVGVEHPEK
jgi:hypothetical protein